MAKPKKTAPLPAAVPSEDGIAADATSNETRTEEADEPATEAVGTEEGAQPDPAAQSEHVAEQPIEPVAETVFERAEPQPVVQPEVPTIETVDQVVDPEPDPEFTALKVCHPNWRVRSLTDSRRRAGFSFTREARVITHDELLATGCDPDELIGFLRDDPLLSVTPEYPDLSPAT